jgi:hypothetical protein
MQKLAYADFVVGTPVQIELTGTDLTKGKNLLLEASAAGVVWDFQQPVAGSAGSTDNLIILKATPRFPASGSPPNGPLRIRFDNPDSAELTDVSVQGTPIACQIIYPSSLGLTIDAHYRLLDHAVILVSDDYAYDITMTGTGLDSATDVAVHSHPDSGIDYWDVVSFPAPGSPDRSDSSIKVRVKPIRQAGKSLANGPVMVRLYSPSNMSVNGNITLAGLIDTAVPAAGTPAPIEAAGIGCVPGSGTTYPTPPNGTPLAEIDAHYYLV